ncbi:MAG: DNA primase [Oribacterium sp.]|nr:DNA primase [Oribacterium sp.]
MNVFEAVKSNITAGDVATMVGFKPNRSKMIYCPFHDDKHPSMKIDKRYYCFGCGARGDAIDFVANYYGIGLKEAAERIAGEFGITYESKKPTVSEKQYAEAEKNKRQKWAAAKRELFASLSELHEHLRHMKTKYEPKENEDSGWSPLFVQAEKDFDYVDDLYDYCMFNTTDEELKKEYQDIVKEIEIIGKRNIDTESGTCGLVAV